MRFPARGAVLEAGEGHAIVDLQSGEVVDPPDAEVLDLDLAIAWSLMEGAGLHGVPTIL